MIDTIRLVKEVNTLPEGFEERLKQIAHKTDVTYKNLQSGDPTKSTLCKVGDLTICYNRSKLTILGSLTTLVTGSNLYFADKDQMLNAVSGLESLLQISLWDASVTRLDIAANIVTNHPALEYCKCLLQINKFERYEQPTGVVFKNKSTMTYIHFYDKIEEMKEKRHQIDPAVIMRHILRYECKFRPDSLKRLINNRRPTLKQVFNHYNVFIDEWKRMFDSIVKQREILDFDRAVFSTKHAFNKALEIEGIYSKGGLKAILDVITDANRKKYFTGHKDQATVLKKRVKGLMNNPLFTKKLDVVTELNSKINMIVGCSLD